MLKAIFTIYIMQKNNKKNNKFRPFKDSVSVVIPKSRYNYYYKYVRVCLLLTHLTTYCNCILYTDNATF